jgi:hypothetical protein
MDIVGDLIPELRVSKAQRVIYNKRWFAARTKHRGPGFGSAYSGGLHVSFGDLSDSSFSRDFDVPIEMSQLASTGDG